MRKYIIMRPQGGDLPADRKERALALSRQKYCAVWNSLRPDIVLATSSEISS